jgi:hypothetical protein
LRTEGRLQGLATAPCPASRAALCDVGNGVGHHASDRYWPVRARSLVHHLDLGLLGQLQTLEFAA